MLSSHLTRLVSSSSATLPQKKLANLKPSSNAFCLIFTKRTDNQHLQAKQNSNTSKNKAMQNLKPRHPISCCIPHSNSSAH